MWLAIVLLSVDLAGSFGHAQTSAATAAQGISRYVDPFIGVDGNGNVFPGPTLPFGMVKLGPDTDQNGNAGYTSAGKILGFSHLHVSGTGGGPKYGVILLAPTIGKLEVSEYGSDRADESAQVGYYTVKLTHYDVKAELTASRRVGFHRYTFTRGEESHILLDVGHFLKASYALESQRFVGGKVQFTSDSEVQGYGRYAGGWNLGREYKVYFCARFDTPSESHGTWLNEQIHSSNTEEAGAGQKLGAFLSYETKPGQVINAKVGISFISSDQACRNIQAEVPGWDFERVRRANIKAWDGVLANVIVQTKSQDLKTAFYTALYHSMLMPSDRTSENPGWQSHEPYYDDYYTIWDTFRTTNPLLTLIQPNREVDIVRSAIDIYRHDGYMPDGRSGNDNGRTQGGSNAEILIADAFVKGLTGIDYQSAYRAMIKDAEAPPADPVKEGRGGIPDYNTKGYVSLAFKLSASKTLEYSYDDFAIAEVARGLGKTADFRRYLGRASNWTNLWDPSVRDGAVTGFIRPRNADGSWLTPFTTTKAGTWPDYFYEADSWEYSLDAPQDVRQLVQKSGGPKKFIERLDLLFDNKHIDVGDEPAFLDPLLYIWAGRPDRTADRVRQILDRSFNATRSGLPGNDDSGAMSSWFIFQNLGFYPNAGQDYYLITAPRFSKSTIHLNNGREFMVIANHLDDAEHPGRYVQSATLNGRPLDQAWFRHADIKNGGVLVLNMGDSPSNWGTQSPPPSLSDISSPRER